MRNGYATDGLAIADRDGSRRVHRQKSRATFRIIVPRGWQREGGAALIFVTAASEVVGHGGVAKRIMCNHAHAARFVSAIAVLVSADHRIADVDAVVTRSAGLAIRNATCDPVDMRDVALSLVAIAILVALLALADNRVREEGTRVAGGGVLAASVHTANAGRRFVAAARDVDTEQMSLALFVVIATGLVIAMLRT